MVVYVTFAFYSTMDTQLDPIACEVKVNDLEGIRRERRINPGQAGMCDIPEIMEVVSNSM